MNTLDELYHLSIPYEDDALGRAVLFATFLSAGVKEGKWGPTFRVSLGAEGYGMWLPILTTELAAEAFDMLTRKWHKKFPLASLMELLNYVEPYQVSGQDTVVRLTARAMRLLRQPATQRSVFIAYHRESSSAAAMLIEARLVLAGVKVYIDKFLVAGDVWTERIEDVIVNKVSHFICVIGSQDALKSKSVKREIGLAMGAKKYCFSFWHNNFQVHQAQRIRDSALIDFVKNRHAIIVKDESALGYEHAIVDLLEAMKISSAPALDPLSSLDVLDF